MLTSDDTIAAIATPPGIGGVGIVRLSGPLAPDMAKQLVGHLPKPRRAEYLPFLDQNYDAIDTGITLFFPAPHSFTGEDVLELHGHGGPVVLDLLMQRVVALGARVARPGEFSLRAFLNGKLDLVQAEAIADLIESASAHAARSSLRSLQGQFSARINQLVQALIELRVYVESALDFAEEEIDFLSHGGVSHRLLHLEESLDGVLASATQGQLLREGMTLVIAGKPNAGKSSLLNRLAGRDRAIVTEIPGTTRDVLTEHIELDGLPLHVVDTAGLRDSDDPVEAAGIGRAWHEIEHADRILLMVDDGEGICADTQAIISRLPKDIGLTMIRNKIDLSGKAPMVMAGDLATEVAISAKTGAGVEALRTHLKQCVGYLDGGGEGSFIARRRHLEALKHARSAIQKGRTQLVQHGAGELLAEELHAAQNALSEITGEFTNEDLLDKIFSSFCIGK